MFFLSVFRLFFCVILDFLFCLFMLFLSIGNWRKINIIYCQQSEFINSKISLMENQIKYKQTHMQYQEFSISPIYSPKIQTSYSPFSEFDNRHRNQSERNKVKFIFPNQKGNLKEEMMCQQVQESNYADYNTLAKQLSKVSINQCEEIITNNPEQKQKVFHVIEMIRKSLCQDHIVLNLNLIMSNGLYQPIISHSSKLAYILSNHNQQNNQNVQTLKQCLWILTNLCTGTQQQIKLMINVGLINLIDMCLKLKPHKLIIVSTLELIGNLVGEQLLDIKLHFLQSDDFYQFYQRRLQEYWYEDDGKFSEKIVWILANTFHRVPTLISDYDKWKQIAIKYLPIFISLLQLSYRTTSNTTCNYLLKQYIQKNNKFQSQQYISSKNSQIESLPCKLAYKTSKKTIKNCYFIFQTITCIDYPYLFIHLHQVVKSYNFQVVPPNCRNFVVRMYANIIGFHCIEGISFVYQYADLLKYIIHEIRAQERKTKQKAHLNIKDSQSPIAPTCLQILASILQHGQSTQKFIKQHFQEFEAQLSHWLVDYKNNGEIISGVMRLLLQLLKVCIKKKLGGVVDRIFYYALGFFHERMNDIVIKVDGLEGCGLHHEDYNGFLSVINNYLHLYVLYFQFMRSGTKESSDSNHKIKHLYTKISETMMQHKMIEQILIKIYNIYNYERKKSTEVQKSASQPMNSQRIQTFISQIQSTSILLNNNVQNMQKMLLDYEMTGLCV